MEKRYESDRTLKDKLELEKEKLKSMHGKEKLDYIWTYYKAWFFVFVLLCMIIVTGVQIYQNSKYHYLLEIAVVNSHNIEGGDKAEKIALDALKSQDSYDRVRFDMTYQLGTDMENADPSLVTKLSTVVTAGELDMMICDKTTYEYYAKQAMFRPMEELLTGEEREAYGDSMEQYAIRLNNSAALKEMNIVAYEPVYAAVIMSSKQVDNAKAMIKYLKEDA